MPARIYYVLKDPDTPETIFDQLKNQVTLIEPHNMFRGKIPSQIKNGSDSVLVLILPQLRWSCPLLSLSQYMQESIKTFQRIGKEKDIKVAYYASSGWGFYSAKIIEGVVTGIQNTAMRSGNPMENMEGYKMISVEIEKQYPQNAKKSKQARESSELPTLTGLPAPSLDQNEPSIIFDTPIPNGYKVGVSSVPKDYSYYVMGSKRSTGLWVGYPSVREESTAIGTKCHLAMEETIRQWNHGCKEDERLLLLL